MPNLTDSGGRLKQRVSDGMVKHKVSGLVLLGTFERKAFILDLPCGMKRIAMSLCRYAGKNTVKQRNDLNGVTLKQTRTDLTQEQ